MTMPLPAMSLWVRFAGSDVFPPLPGRLDGAFARVDGVSTRPPSTPTSATKTAPGRPPASPGVMTIARPAFALSAQATACALNAACRAPIAIHIWSMPLRSLRAWMASATRLSRPTFSKAISTPPEPPAACALYAGASHRQVRKQRLRASRIRR